MTTLSAIHTMRGSRAMIGVITGPDGEYPVYAQHSPKIGCSTVHTVIGGKKIPLVGRIADTRDVSIALECAQDELQPGYTICRA